MTLEKCHPRWFHPAAVTLSLLGFILSAYLTIEHYTGSTTLACSASGAVDCHKVTTSKYSSFLGIPVALLGLIYFSIMLATLILGSSTRANKGAEIWRWALLGAGFIFVMYLIWAEFKVGSICLWCTGVHAVVILLIVASLISEASSTTRPAGSGV